MIEIILGTLKIMGWLGLILGILVIVNITTGTLNNVWSSKEEFSWKKMVKGLLKAIIFYLSAVFLSVALSILPYVNDMITEVFGVVLVASETLETLSSVGVLGIVMAAIVVQAKKAITGITTFSNVTTGDEEITWSVEEE